MYKTSFLQKLAILIALALPEAMNGQVPVDISSQKIISEGIVYYMHPVLKGQTLYSISRAYNVTIDDITRANVIPPNGIQAEQVLKIPAPQAVTSSQIKPKVQAPPQAQQKSLPETRPQSNSQKQTDFQEASETVGPAEKTPTAPQIQNKMNPDAQPQIDAAKTPEKKPAKAERDEVHKVKKGESLSSIARDHGVTERELRKANKGLLFPMPGMYLVIPAKEDERKNQGKSE